MKELEEKVEFSISKHNRSKQISVKKKFCHHNRMNEK